MDKKKVLVVDDEIHIVHIVAIKLRNNGYEVVTAENGQQGYELACEEMPDIIVASIPVLAVEAPVVLDKILPHVIRELRGLVVLV